MKRPRKDYWLSLDDESRLERIARMRLTPLRAVGGGIAALAISVALGAAVVAATPLRSMLPGYLHGEERTQNEETMLRLDSLQAAYETNQEYLANLQRVLNPDRTPFRDSIQAAMHPVSMTADSLISIGETARERDFVRDMEQREKYNVTVLAPLAAESIMFYPPCDRGAISSETASSTKARILAPSGSTLVAIADGTVLSMTTSAGGTSILIQHPKGFVSRLSGTRQPLVAEGDYIYGGQAIAMAPAPSRRADAGKVYLELWHNGTRLVPAEYVTRQTLLQTQPGSGDLTDGSARP